MSIKSNVIIHPGFLENQQYNNLKKNKFKKPEPKKILLLSVVALVLILVSLTFGRFIWLNYKLGKEIQTYLAEVDQLKQEQEELMFEIELAKDPAFIEKVARERLGLVKEGEKVIMPAKPGEVIPLKKPAPGEIQH